MFSSYVPPRLLDSNVLWCIPKHNTCNASLALTLYQLQQENSNGRLLLLTQGCVYAIRAEIVTMVGLFPYDDVVYVGSVS